MIPSKEVLEQNLDALSLRWNPVLLKKTKVAIENCKKHFACVEKLKVNQGKGFIKEYFPQIGKHM